ncbi:unknown protein [Seminavis robusta]|uniref:SAM domain-containing protein n=1 Tax=Seminavis robusta TaxID=568900 RepID=A0A9N8DTV1_9STRA|nr:unknown protein [Seminavis robusta]|eukprot:Sro366_g127690.1 n/a (357) ;mRNA; r:71054-72285
MGSAPSKTLEEWSSEDLSQELTRLGPKYQSYSGAIADNGLDGSILASLTDQELDETLDDLGFQNRLHRLVVRKKLAAVSRSSSKSTSSEEELTQWSSHPCLEETTTAIHSERQKDQQVTPEREEEVDNDEELTEADLAIFDDIVADILEKTNDSSICYVGVHLIQNEGQLLLSGALRESEDDDDHSVDSLQRWHLRPHQESLCSTLVRTKTQDTFMKVKLPRMGMTYRGHVLCNSHGHREMAGRVERHMRPRETLITKTAARKARLKLSLEGDDAEPELTHLFQGAAEMLEKENNEPEQVAKPPSQLQPLGYVNASDHTVRRGSFSRLPPEQTPRPLLQPPESYTTNNKPTRTRRR